MSFVQSIKSGFSKYFNVSSRSSRSEYWSFTIFVLLCSMIAATVDASFLGVDPNASNYGPIQAIFAILTFIPSFTVSVRRLHDVNRSGWWLLIVLTIIGILVLLYWLAKKGTDGSNNFGENPLQE